MPPFRVPHYHVLLRCGYRIWTYIGFEAEKRTRERARALFYAGQRPVILTCRIAGCRLYDTHTPDDLSEEKIHARLDKVRHSA